MLNRLKRFELITRNSHAVTERPEQERLGFHPFDVRNIHPRLPPVVKELFDDGHFAQATFEAFKYVDKEVQRFSGSQESGFKLMMQVFAGNPPAISLTKMSNTSEQDEQKGYQFIFAGSALAIRNPRGHEYGVKDDPDRCLDHLSLASLLLRRLEDSDYK